MEDRLSQLPDDVLVSILSKLTLKEKVITSCLSSGWRRHIWTCVTRLNFNLPTEDWDRTEFCRKEALRHINWVNHVLGLHKSSFLLEEFTVSSLFHSSFQCEVDKLLEFALSTKVQSLKIEFIPLECPDIRYIQPCLDLKTFQKYLSSSLIFGFKNLKVLTLGGVDVDNQVVNIFLSSCPLLEQLSIRKSQVLKHLEIGPSLKLKHLEIYKCKYIDYLEICNANIVSFCFYGIAKTNLLLENVTSVVDLQIEIFHVFLPRLIELITTKFTQLVKLSLEVIPCQYEGVYYYHSFPKFNNLKWLILTVIGANDYSSLLKVTPLLQASPYLQIFEIKITWSNTLINIPSAPIICHGPIRKVIRQNPYPYPYLKVVKYEGYLGGSADNEFVTYLVENSLALEKFIVTPCDHSSYCNKSSKVERRSRSRAWRQLQGKVPDAVKLVIL